MIGLLILASALFLSAGAASIAYASVQKRLAAPTRELATAVRVLDRILAYDDAVSSLSRELRSEATAIVHSYHGELNQ